MTLGDVAWASIAESVRMAAYAATTEDELEQALAHALRQRGPALVDTRIDPSTYDETLRLIRG